MTLGELLKENRKKRDKTQKQVAKEIGIGSKHLSNIERDVKNPGKQTLGKLIGYYGINPEKVLKVQKKKNQKKSKYQELEEKELELINTYDYFRQQNSSIAKKAIINRILIDYAKVTEELIFKLELLLAEENEMFYSKIHRPLRTTIQSMENKISRLKNYYNLNIIKNKI